MKLERANLISKIMITALNMIQLILRTYLT